MCNSKGECYTWEEYIEKYTQDEYRNCFYACEAGGWTTKCPNATQTPVSYTCSNLCYYGYYSYDYGTYVQADSVIKEGLTYDTTYTLYVEKVEKLDETVWQWKITTFPSYALPAIYQIWYNPDWRPECYVDEDCAKYLICPGISVYCNKMKGECVVQGKCITTPAKKSVWEEIVSIWNMFWEWVLSLVGWK